MATSTAPFPLATDYSGGQDGAGQPGDANSGNGSSGSGDVAGASGTNGGGIQISRGAMIAIIVVVVVVALIGIASSVLFYLAKKREWRVRETIRKSARRVVTALTPRRTEFPKSVKDGLGGQRSKNGRMRLDDVPPTPRLKPEDLEKGLQIGLVPKKSKRGNFSRK